MPRLLWSAATLLLLAQAVPAAQGTHPGPLPAPIGAGADATAGAPPTADPPSYRETRTFGTSRAFGSPGGPRGAGDDYFDRGGGPGAAGYPPAAPGRAYGPEDSGYGTAPGTGRTYGTRRGYWQWVPAEPDYDQGGRPDYGYGRDHAPYTPYGYAPYDGYGYGDGYRDAYPGGGFGPSDYGGPGLPYPDYGAARGHGPDPYHYPRSDYPPEPPGGAFGGGPSLPFPAASDPPR
jgi:hypothetical protein